MTEIVQNEVKKALWRRLHNKVLWWAWYRWHATGEDSNKRWRW